MGISMISEFVLGYFRGMAEEEASATGPGSKLPPRAPTESPNIDQFVI